MVSTAFSVFGEMFSTVFALVIAFTALSQREKLTVQAKTVLYAYAQPARADYIAKYIRKVGRVFSQLYLWSGTNHFFLRCI